jgi:hypothetical protein
MQIEINLNFVHSLVASRLSRYCDCLHPAKPSMRILAQSIKVYLGGYTGTYKLEDKINFAIFVVSF